MHPTGANHGICSNIHTAKGSGWYGAVVTHLTCNQKIPSSILGASFLVEVVW